jgi:hypothetical protein
MIFGFVNCFVPWFVTIFINAPSHEKIQDYESGSSDPESYVNGKVDKTPICGNLGEIPGATEGLRKMKNY